jgi:hypothetical protein
MRKTKRKRERKRYGQLGKITKKSSDFMRNDEKE